MEQTEQAPVPKINVTYCPQIEDISDIKPMRTDIIPDLSHKVKNWYYLYQPLTIPSCHTLSSFRPTGTACKPVFTIFNILISPETRLILPSVVFLHDPKNSVIKLGFFPHWGYCLPRCPQSTHWSFALPTPLSEAVPLAARWGQCCSLSKPVGLKSSSFDK